MLAKSILWAVVLTGLLLAVGVGYMSHWIEGIVGASGMPPRYGVKTSSNDRHIHDSYTSVVLGPLTLRVFPRTWASLLILAGAIAVVVGLVFILHVPHSHSA